MQLAVDVTRLNKPRYVIQTLGAIRGLLGPATGAVDMVVSENVLLPLFADILAGDVLYSTSPTSEQVGVCIDSLFLVTSSPKG